ncbi:YheC/YheD family protein [Paenibacillus sp. N1-5-1-14]|uniref:YheC/YheD family endospore coat-associated protein n=1 Tax=Paenibacillus radicibacter TaxID=2972488 RepID=UPI002159AFB0|nr:YheC/YheD family protein [Paenibacillus radicibacter]MCR8643694.1 YheC/YheD family protein [Paenibacillus radicibacter]
MSADSSHEHSSSPSIGILTVADKSDQFQGNRSNFIDLIRIGSTYNAKVFVVTAEDLNLSSTRVHAFCYDQNNEAWFRQWMPFPQVIYNRIPYRHQEMQPEVQQKIQACIKQKNLHLFNPGFFNKWSLYKWLSESSETNDYIPITQQLSTSNDLESLIKLFPIIYLKPVRGKAGKGIMLVERKSLNPMMPLYKLTIQDTTKTQNSLHSTSATLWKKIQKYQKNEEYIIQQGIDLANYKDRPYDLRALIQKNSKGEWSFTGIGARLAGASSITTHVPRGGSIEDPEKMLSQTFGNELAQNILKQMKSTALFIAKHIERSSGQLLGEMSMDLGIDKSGRTWFFEANSKPMKFDEPHIRKKSLERIIRFSIFLAKKNKKRR